jgi:hypothetical protein
MAVACARPPVPLLIFCARACAHVSLCSPLSVLVSCARGNGASGDARFAAPPRRAQSVSARPRRDADGASASESAAHGHAHRSHVDARQALNRSVSLHEAHRGQPRKIEKKTKLRPVVVLVEDNGDRGRCEHLRHGRATRADDDKWRVRAAKRVHVCGLRPVASV